MEGTMEVEKTAQTTPKAKHERNVSPHREVSVVKPTYVDKVVEVVEYQYKEVPVERIVEVPEVRNEVVVKEVEVPLNVDVPIIQSRQVPVEQKIQRNIPTPIDVTSVQQYEMPQLKPRYKEIPVPIYVPRYIEVPVPSQFVPQEQQGRKISHLSAGPAMSSLPQPALIRSAQSKEPLVYNPNTGFSPQQQLMVQPEQQQLISQQLTAGSSPQITATSTKEVSGSRQVSTQSQQQQMAERAPRSVSGLTGGTAYSGTSAPVMVA